MPNKKQIHRRYALKLGLGFVSGIGTSIFNQRIFANNSTQASNSANSSFINQANNLVANDHNFTGAQVDESNIQQTIYVRKKDKVASDSNSGTTNQKPLKTISAALQKAKEYLNQGQGVKILIDGGIYREGELVIDGKQLSSKARESILVIEGSSSAKSVISGSELWHPKTWEKVQRGGVTYYQHDWPYDFGNHGGPWGKHGPKEVIGHRSEMVFINGKPVKQVLLENYNYTWPDSFKGRGTHEYIGFNPPEDVLKPNQFGVAELDINSNKIYIRPEDSVDFANARIQVSTKRFIFQFVHKNNVVLRNLKFQHCAGSLSVDREGSAVNFGPWWHGDNEFVGGHILIEDCDFRWNNSRGLSLEGVNKVTMRRNKANNNGFMGIGAYILMDTVWEDNETSYNNWRGYMSNFHYWSIAGAKLVCVRNGIFRDHKCLGNIASGLWFDIGNKNILIEKLCAVQNQGPGLFLEISPGPLVVRKSLLAGNGRSNLLISETTNLTVENSIIYGLNKEEPILFLSGDWRTFTDGVGKILGESNTNNTPIFLGETRLNKNIIFASKINQSLIRQETGNPDLYKQFIREDYHGRDNLFWSPDQEVFGIGFSRNKMTDLEAWKNLTDEVNPQFKDPLFIAGENYNFWLQKNSPLSNVQSSLPLQKLSKYELRKLKNFTNWLDK